MKKTLVFSMMAVMLCMSLNAATLAYWRFEDGTNGTAHTGDNDDWYADSSGNGNAMSTVDSASRPIATNDVPFSVVPQTAQANNLALDFGNWNSYITTTGSKMIDTKNLSNGWTVEASVKFHSLGAGWPGVVTKTGRPPGPGAPPLFMKLIALSPAFLQCDFFSDDDAEHWFDGRSGYGGTGELSILVDTWYNLAFVYDGTNEAKLYIKEATDLTYEWEATSQQSGIGDATLHWDTPWVVGCTMWDNNLIDFADGVIDEVRISDEPLEPTQFLAVVPEPCLAIGGMALALLAFRKVNRIS